MSEPFIKVWAADMRADPKIAALNRLYPGGAYLLIQLWDLAKNGPGEPDELLGPDSRPMRPRMILELTHLPTDDDDDESDTPSDTWSYQRVKACIDTMRDLGLCERSTSGSIRFPTLKRRQGIDSTNAARQARFRARRKAESNAQSNGDVTEPVTDALTPYARADQSQSQKPGPSIETVEEGRKQHAHPEHGHDQQIEIPNQLRRIVGDKLLGELKPGQLDLVVRAYLHATEQFRESLADIEGADKPVAMLVHKAGELAPPVDPDAPTPAEKRQKLIHRIRYLANQAAQDGEPPHRTREWLEQEYHQTPGIVTEALGPASQDIPL